VDRVAGKDDGAHLRQFYQQAGMARGVSRRAQHDYRAVAKYIRCNKPAIPQAYFIIGNSENLWFWELFYITDFIIMSGALFWYNKFHISHSKKIKIE